MQIAVKAPHRRQRPRHRTLAQSPPCQLGQKTAHRQPVDALPGPIARAVVRSEEVEQLAQISRVRFDRVRRDVALFGEMGEKIRNLAGNRQLARIGRAVCCRGRLHPALR